MLHYVVLVAEYYKRFVDLLCDGLTGPEKDYEHVCASNTFAVLHKRENHQD